MGLNHILYSIYLGHLVDFDMGSTHLIEIAFDLARFVISLFLHHCL
jgi:hypothetical protein